LQRLLLGTLVVADLDPRWLISHILSRSPGHLGPYKEEDLLRLSGHPRRAVVDRCQDRVNDSGRPGALRRTGVLRSKQTGQPSYARVSREGHRIAVACDDYPKIQVTREHFVDIQRAIGRLVYELPEEGFTPSLADSYWSKGAAIMVCQDEMTRDWLVAKVPALAAWEGSRLKVVGLEALSTFKRVAAWFPGPAQDTERCFSRLRRLNRYLDTGQLMVYERREDPKGVRLVLSIDAASATVLEGLRWRPFSGVGQAVFSLLGAKPEGRK
jgi:hypothetical protein